VFTGQVGIRAESGTSGGYVVALTNGSVRFNGITAPTDGTYTIAVSYRSGDPRYVQATVNGDNRTATWLWFGASGNGTSTQVVQVNLHAGSDNTVSLGCGASFNPLRIDQITLSP
jgi:hypothetical protein